MKEVIYEVGFPSELAEKEFLKVLSKSSKKEQERILEWFDRLTADPRPKGKSFTKEGIFNYTCN